MIIDKKIYYTFFAIFYLSSFFYSRINIEIGFSLKLFMICSFFVFVLNLKSFKFYFNIYDYIFIIFVSYASITVLFSLDIISSFRMMLGSLIIMFCYFVFKFFLIKHILLNNISIDKIIIPTVIIFIVISLALYCFGIIVVDNNFVNNEHNRIFGIYIERYRPRLIGLNIDPNITVFSSLLVLYYLYFLENKNLLIYILLVFLFLLILLTISVAGLISIAIPLLIYYFYKFLCLFLGNTKISIKNIIILTFIIISCFIAFNLISTNDFVLNIIDERVNSLSNGSGRFEIWSNALNLFYEHPICGIGWYNFLEYNKIYFGLANYMHNTFLETLVELGIFGFLIYVFFLIVLFISVLKLQCDKNNRYLFFTFLSTMVMLNSLSLYINEIFFVFMTFVSYELYKLKLKRKNI